jgi:hypothetical protein
VAVEQQRLAFSRLLGEDIEPAFFNIIPFCGKALPLKEILYVCSSLSLIWKNRIYAYKIS